MRLATVLTVGFLVCGCVGDEVVLESSTRAGADAASAGQSGAGAAVNALACPQGVVEDGVCFIAPALQLSCQNLKCHFQFKNCEEIEGVPTCTGCVEGSAATETGCQPTDTDADGVFDSEDTCPEFDDRDCTNGTCVDGACVCDLGWTGELCAECLPGFFGVRCAPCSDCGDKGTCDDGPEGTGLCVCDSGRTGSVCDSCAPFHFGPDCRPCAGCTGNAVCDDGPLGTGACTCANGFFGADCQGCPECGPRATCEDGRRGSGACVCNAGAFGPECETCPECGAFGRCADGRSGNGSCLCQPGWVGSACDQCAPGHFGDSCAACPDCGGHGACKDGQAGDGQCLCEPGFVGPACEDCAEGRLGPNCTPCPDCGATGVCTLDAVTGPRCTCDEGFAGPACDDCAPGRFGPGCTACPDCGEHGSCSAGKLGTGACLCEAGYSGVHCDRCAPGSFGPNCQPCIACGDNGRCQDGDRGNGQCVCQTGWTGDGCDRCADGFWGADCLPCPNCGPDGVCDSGPSGDGLCQCASNRTGAHCEACAEGFFGPDCREAPDCGARGRAVGGLFGDGSCQCDAGFEGAACDRCAAGRFGPNCAACVECGPNGRCSDGISGDGSCICSEGFSGVRCDACSEGFVCEPCAGCSDRGRCDVSGQRSRCLCDDGWDGGSCDRCASGHFGPDCDPCASCGLGTCADGLTADGTCTCPSNFTGPNCAECAVGAFGADCDPCPSCGEHGACDDGRSGSGACVCDPGFAAPSCTSCEPTRTGDTCSRCLPGFFGADCAPCDECVSGICGATGECICDPGFTGSRCNTCEAGHFGPSCLPCADCGLNGTCSEGIGNDGACICDAGYDGPRCDVCSSGRVGSACDDCDAGFFGPDCTPCPLCVNGACGEGIAGDGFCSCEEGFAGALCDTCDPGHWGEDCLACDCPAGVACNEGIAGTGCSCDDPYVDRFCVAPANCTHLQTLYGEASGDRHYMIDPDGAGTFYRPFEAYCQLSAYGGGWTLVANYLHQGGTNPPLIDLQKRLPTRGGDDLGADESATAHWGHAGNQLLTALHPVELRFFGDTDFHNRRIHFRTDDPACVEYGLLGRGHCSGLLEGPSQNFTPFIDHTANLPGLATHYHEDRGDRALTDFPFWRYGPHHWAMAGNTNRWELDDVPGNSSRSTLHRIFIRSDSCPPSKTGDRCERCAPGYFGARCLPATNCTDLHARDPSVPSGHYQIDPDGQAPGLGPMMAYCDMDTDGGGWTLVLNYNRAANDTTPTRPSADRYPRLGSTELIGGDGDTQEFLHVVPGLLRVLNPVEARFFGQTTHHDRIMNFKTDDRRCLQYFETGSGDCKDLKDEFTPLQGHTTALPGTQQHAHSNRGDLAMADFPFFGGGAHWGAGLGNRWEVDDFRGREEHTRHQIFIRSRPSCTGAPCYPRSCRAHKAAVPGATSGLYWLDADGSGSLPPFQTFCDMDIDDGSGSTGWTLIFAAGATPGGNGMTEGARGISRNRMYLSHRFVRGLIAGGATKIQIHNRNLPDQFMRSRTSVPLDHLEAGHRLNTGPANQDATEHWEGPKATTGIINPRGCASPAGTYPQLYMACGNSVGLHIDANVKKFNHSQANESLEVYLK